MINPDPEDGTTPNCLENCHERQRRPEQPPRLRPGPAGHRRLCPRLPHRLPGRIGHRPPLPDGHPRLWPAGPAFSRCTKHLGPLVEGTVVPFGARVPGTSFRLDPVKAAWDIGCIVRWLDYNDTWLAAEWGHPSDNLGGILAIADHLSQKHLANGEAPLTIRAVLEAMIMAHEIQGVIALENSFNRVGLDHVLLVKVASTAVTAKLMGANREQLLSALSHAFADGQALRTYRHAPNAGD